MVRKIDETIQPGAVPAKTTNTTTINMKKDDETCLDCLEIQDEGRGPNRKMTKGRAREIAKDMIQHQLGVAYYLLEGGTGFDNYTEEEQDLINVELDKLCERACKAIGIRYVTF